MTDQAAPNMQFIVRYLVRRKPAIEFDDFRRHQLEVHVPLVLKLPGLVGYAISLFPPEDGIDQAFDAMATLAFESRSAHDAALASPEGQTALADREAFLNMDEPMLGLACLPGDDLIVRRSSV